MINFIKKNKGPILTFFITVFLVLLIFFEVGILSGTILISDLNAEYQPLLMQVRRILTGQMGLFDFNTGMGDNFIGTFYYYVSCPLNILTLFIKNINLLVIILVTLKLSLASTFAYIFFKYQVKEEKITLLTIFSLIYAFTSFSLAYYLHIMWLDIYLILPLLLLGIDKIIKEKKHLLYTISLVLIIFCNYYFAYMVCIFSFIYFNYKLLSNKQTIKYYLKENIHFIIVSFLSVLCASIVLLPVASEISTYSRQNGMLFGGEDLSFKLDIITSIKQYILGNYKDVDLLNDNGFFVYSSIIVIPLLYLYFINKEFKLREKILTGLILLLFVLSIGCNYLNYAWHGFVPPSFFNGRYTFMFILFILMICIKSICNLKEFKTMHYFIISVGTLFVILIYNFLGKLELSSFDIIKIFLFLSYVLILILIPSLKHIKYFLFFLICIELNMSSFSYLTRYNFAVSSSNDDYGNVISYIKEIDDEPFYRIEDNTTSSDNYSIFYDYYSIDYFMSTVKKDLINFFINLDVGNHSYTKNTISYDGNFKLISSLLNIKYYIETQNLENVNYKLLTKSDDIYPLYLNEHSLNLGYMVNKNILNTKLDSNGLENINNIYKDMIDTEVLKKVDIEKIDDYTYKFKNTKKNNFYLLVKLNNWYSYDDLEVTLNEVILGDINHTFNYEVINEFEKDEDINIYISANEGTINDIEGIYVYYIDDKKYDESINKLKEHQLNVTKVKPNKIIGTIDVEDNDILFTSIPYSNDLDIYVDGKKVEKIKLLDTFIGAKIEKGTHDIMIKYTPKVLYISFIPSILSGFILWLYLKLYKRKNKSSNSDEIDSKELDKIIFDN